MKMLLRFGGGNGKPYAVNQRINVFDLFVILIYQIPRGIPCMHEFIISPLANQWVNGMIGMILQADEAAAVRFRARLLAAYSPGGM